MKNRVLLTGAGGFASRYIAPCLAERGYEVIGTSNTQDNDTIDGMTSRLSVDLLDSASLSELVQSVQPSHVVHLAAISFVAHEDTTAIYQTNIVGTRNLLKALAELPEAPQSVLLTSSANVYGNSTKGVLSENDDINPANDYAVSKIAMEYMSRQFSDKLNLTVIRPFNFTGRGQSGNFLIPKIVNHFKSGADHIELGNIDVSRDFSDVRSVADYVTRLLGSPLAHGQTYNICTGKAYSLSYIINTCERITGHRMEVRINPAFVRANEVKSLVGDPQKLHHDVGKSEDFDFDDTLKWMLEA